MLNDKDNICLGCGTQLSQLMGNNNFNGNQMQQGYGMNQSMPQQPMMNNRQMRGQQMPPQMPMNQQMRQPMMRQPQRGGTSRFTFRQNIDDGYEQEEKTFLQKYGIIIITLIVLVAIIPSEIWNYHYYANRFSGDSSCFNS
jgi:hypothetical protein